MSTTPSSPELANPFPGLRSFQSDEKHLFFGREDQVGELLERLRQSRFLAVVGPSGSGKSSLVRAGLLPELHGGTMVSAGSHWEVVLMRPGGDPLTNLASALVQADLYDPDQPGIVDQVRTTLDRSALGLAEAVRQSDLEENINTLVVVDQFEEIFRFRDQGGQSLEEASAFVKLLLEASQQVNPSVYIVITMRSDYLGECAEFRGLAEAVNEGEYLIPRLTRAQRRSAISGPIQVGGAEISKRLLTKLLNDVGDDPDQLPVLQHALMRTWDLWAADHEKGETVDLRHYEATGGMQEALSRHADEVFEALGGESGKVLAEKVFRSLTERVNENRGIRRPLRLGRLAEIVNASVEEVCLVLEAFRAKGCTFLMPPHGVELKTKTVIDISHESLMRGWQRLRHWVDEESQSAGIYRRLDETARLHGKGRASLYHDPDLQIALSWKDEDQPNSAWAGLYGGNFDRAMAFLDQSQTEAERLEKEKEAARQRELEQAKALAVSQKRSAVLMRRFAITVCLALVVAVGLAGWALRESNIAKKAKIKSMVEQGKTWLANALALKNEGDLFGAKIKAARAIGFEGQGRQNQTKAFKENYPVLLQSPDQPEWKQAEQILADLSGPMPLWQNGSLPQHFDYVNDIAVSPADTIAATVGEDVPDIRIWDTKTGRLIDTLVGHTDDVEALAFSRDGSFLASGETQNLILWEIKNQTFTQKAYQVIETENIRSLAFSPAGDRLMVAEDSGRFLVWNLNEDEIQPVAFGHQGDRILDLEFSHDGSLLASAGDEGTVEIRDGQDYRLLASLQSSLESSRSQNRRSGIQVRNLAFSPDGKYLASGGRRLPVTLWNMETREEIGYLLVREFESIAYDDDGQFRYGGRHLITDGLDFSGDGNLLAVGWFSANQQDVPMIPTVTLFDVSGENILQPKRVHEFKGHLNAITRVKFTADSQRLLSGDSQGLVRFWDVPNREPVGGATDAHFGRITRVAFSPGGRFYASADRNGLMMVRNAVTGELVSQWGGHQDQVRDFCFSLDGSKVFSVGFRDRSFRAWDVATGDVLLDHDLDMRSTSVDVSPDGTKVIVSGWRNRLYLFDAETLESVREYVVPSGMSITRFFPTGMRVAAFHGSSDGEEIEVFVFGLEEDGTVRQLGHTGTDAHANDNYITDLAISPDGSQMITVAPDRVRLWNLSPEGAVSAAEFPGVLGQEASLSSHSCVAFSPDSQRILLPGQGGAAGYWELADGHLISQVRFPYDISDAVVNPDGAMALLAGTSGILQLWALGSDNDPTLFRGLSGRQDHWLNNGSGAMVFHPTNGFLFVAAGLASNPSTIVGWDVSGPFPEKTYLLEGFRGYVRTMICSPDGRYLAAVTSDPENEVLLWDFSSGSPTLKAATSETPGRDLAFSADQRTLVTGHQSGSVRFWDMTDELIEAREPLVVNTDRATWGVKFSPLGDKLYLSGRVGIIQVHSFDEESRATELIQTLRGMGNPTTLGMDVSGDGRLLAIGNLGQQVRLVDVASGKRVGPNMSHGRWIFNVAFSPDSTRLASAGGANRVKLWDVMNPGKILAEYVVADDESGFVSDICFSPDGSHLAASHNSGEVRLFKLSSVSEEIDLTAFATLVNLETASGDLDWRVRSASLQPPTQSLAFLEIDSTVFPFLRENEPGENQLENWFAHYNEVENFPAAHAVIMAMNDPVSVETARQDFNVSILDAFNKYRDLGENKKARQMLNLLSLYSKDGKLNPEVEFFKALTDRDWKTVLRILPASLDQASGPSARKALLDAVYKALRQGLDQRRQAQATELSGPFTELEIKLVSAMLLKDFLEEEMRSWTAGLIHEESAHARFFGMPEVSQLNRDLSETSQVLVNKGAIWNYFPNNAAPPPDWKTLDFDDAGWLSGPADIGFANDDKRGEISTLIERFQGRITYYFRHSFQLDNLPSHSSLVSSMLRRDDGAVIYLNGHSIRRDNLIKGEIDDITFSLATMADEDEIKFFPAILPPNILKHLRPGKNVLAAEVHQTGPGSSDVHFDLEIRIQESPAINTKLLGEAVALLKRFHADDHDTALGMLLKDPETADSEVASEQAPLWWGRLALAGILLDPAREAACLEKSLAAAALGAKQSVHDLSVYLRLLRSALDLHRQNGNTEQVLALEELLRLTPARPADRKDNQIDLTPYYNASLFHYSGWHNWPWNDWDFSSAVRGLPRFDVRGVIQLDSGKYVQNRNLPDTTRSIASGQTVSQVTGRDWPDRVNGIEIGRPCSRVEAIAGALVSHAGEQSVMAKLVFHYRDGTQEEMNLRSRQEIYDVRGGNGETASQRPWASPNPNLRLTYLSWENPHPEKELASIDFISTGAQASPFLAAITVD